MIKINLYHNGEPAQVLRDSNGILIAPGLRVAYNVSGTVQIGEIKSLRKTKWTAVRDIISAPYGPIGWWHLKFELEIINSVTGKCSIIKNPNSFIII